MPLDAKQIAIVLESMHEIADTIEYHMHICDNPNCGIYSDLCDDYNRRAEVLERITGNKVQRI